MVETRRVVNAILRELCDAPVERGGVTDGRRPDQIHIELVREAKKSFEQRRQLRFDNADRQRERESVAKEIEQLSGRPTPGMKQKFQLWKQQGQMCPYSGHMISPAQVLSEATDVDHILPRWRSLDDSMMNKVVCFREENSGPGGKGSQTPREWLEKSDPDKWSRVLRCAEKLPYPKYRRFLQEGITLGDFVSRQLSDTAYISRAVSQYVRSLGTPVITPRGGMTAELRRFWGLNLLLGDDGEKNRADHRHHAVDAAIIALTNRARLHALARCAPAMADSPPGPRRCAPAYARFTPRSSSHPRCLA
jgi:CRISPR-associated endonuclease Csn1